ncbi:hypothetical protein IE53DRAFT_256091 [Violaceomyces palustris]|uniref:Uncharacterized protein n=1 Tax=Violaceomyces palustris TaxID=1673888 RepID=A0ACD0NNA6_9BASI|nr:hypothetical protein IE53DRAFT_256091 [Violaceomyces palustris]
MMTNGYEIRSKGQERKRARHRPSHLLFLVSLPLFRPISLSPIPWSSPRSHQLFSLPPSLSLSLSLSLSKDTFLPAFSPSPPLHLFKFTPIPSFQIIVFFNRDPPSKPEVERRRDAFLSSPPLSPITNPPSIPCRRRHRRSAQCWGGGWRRQAC